MTTAPVTAATEADVALGTDGKAEVTIADTIYYVTGVDVDHARQQVLTLLSTRAGELGQPLRTRTHGAEGGWTFVVHPDGTLAPDEAPAVPVAEPVAVPVAEPVAVPVAEPVAVPVAEPVAEPAAVPVAEPVREAFTAPNFPQPSEPLPSSIVEAVSEAAPAPTSTRSGTSTGAASTDTTRRLADTLTSTRPTAPTFPKTAAVTAIPPLPPAARSEVVASSAPSTADRTHTPAGQDVTEAEVAPTAHQHPKQRESFLTRRQAESPATQGLRGAMSLMGLRVGPSASELAFRADRRAVSQHWPTPRTIYVANEKGGVGKTPTVVCLSAVFARYGGAGVLAWDNNQTRGTLGWRTEQGPHKVTLHELLPHVGDLLGPNAQAAHLAAYTHHQREDHYDVLRSKPVSLAVSDRVTRTDVDRIHQVASKYYRLIFIDSGNDVADPIWQRGIDHTDQLVIATTTRDDHAEAGARLLEALSERDEHSARLAREAVVVVNTADARATREDKNRMVTAFSHLAREAVVIPHDPGMVDGILRYDGLRPATQRAWLNAAAHVARGL